MKDFAIDEILSAIDGSLGVMSRVAKKLGCDWTTANTYVNKHETTKVAFATETERALDLAETTVLKSIQVDADVNSAKWFLAKKGKHRGYGDEVKIDMPTANINIYKLPDGTELNL